MRVRLVLEWLSNFRSGRLNICYPRALSYEDPLHC